MDTTLTLKHILIYPIKSLGGIALEEAWVEKRGLQYDRRWMIVDEKGLFLSQRTLPKMALLQVALQPNHIIISVKADSSKSVIVPIKQTTGNNIRVTIWDDQCIASIVSKEANDFLSDFFDQKVTLVFMGEDSLRPVEDHRQSGFNMVSFADAFPVLLVGQSSINELNSRLKEPVSIDRFRPNLVFEGGDPYIEDQFENFSIGEVAFKGIKPCSRCQVININQQNGVKALEPLTTLAKYRKTGNKVMFGENVIQLNLGKIKVGDTIKVSSFKNNH